MGPKLPMATNFTAQFFDICEANFGETKGREIALALETFLQRAETLPEKHNVIFFKFFKNKSCKFSKDSALAAANFYRGTNFKPVSCPGVLNPRGPFSNF